MSSKDLDAAFAKATDAITAITNDVRPPAYRKAFGALLEVMGQLRTEVEALVSSRKSALSALAGPSAEPQQATSPEVAEKLESR